jgi:hypothetical protein
MSDTLRNTIELDISQIGPQLIGHRLEVVDVRGLRQGIRLGRYEETTDGDGNTQFILYSDPSPVAVRVWPGTVLKVAATGLPDASRAAVDGSAPTGRGPGT